MAGETPGTAPWSSGSGPAKTPAPDNACDCHMHIYDSRYPAAPAATLRPGDAFVADYRLVQRRTGTTRTVVVTPSTYGTDNRCTIDAMAALGPSARGVAVLDDTVSEAELQRLHGLGMRGIRFNLVQAGATTIDMLEPLAARIAPLGWHVQLHLQGDRIAEIEDRLRRLPAPVVFDHLGRLPQPAGTDHPAFGVISRLLDAGRAWVKLSGAYIDTRSGPPRYLDTSKVAAAYVKAAPERLVWGSDWPHPTETQKPDDAGLFDLLALWASDAATRRRILVENPAALYGFAAPA